VLKRVCLLGFLFLLILIAPTFISLGEEDPASDVEIYLISNEIHTDIVVPVKNQVYDWSEFIDPQDFGETPSEWMEFGWGDKDYYMQVPTWNEFTWKITFDALFLPGEAVMHVNYLNEHPRIYETHRRITISNENYHKLVNTIQGHFKLRGGKPIVLQDKGYTESDNFYEAHGSFSVFKTCNVWTSDVLAEVGLKHPLWSPTKYGLNFTWDAD
jgi:uncharacterized protein (TIGR02117 family)